VDQIEARDLAMEEAPERRRQAILVRREPTEVPDTHALDRHLSSHRNIEPSRAVHVGGDHLEVDVASELLAGAQNALDGTAVSHRGVKPREDIK
jgi:hypothetical protein